MIAGLNEIGLYIFMFIMPPCAIEDVEAVEASTARVFARHTHDSYGVGVITHGAQRSWSGRGMVEAGQGDLITCNPGEVHDGAPIGGARTWRMLYLPPRLATELVADIRERPSDDFEFTNPVFDGKLRVRDFNAAYAALTQHVAAEFAQEHLIVLLSALVRTKPAGALPHPALARAKARIDDDPAATITLADLALQTQLSRFQLIRGFSRLTGLTLHAYIVQRRLERARAMIAKGAALTDVAAACGFADQSHLNRTFVRRYGMTPGAYACALRR